MADPHVSRSTVSSEDWESRLRKQIEEYYLPQQLVDAIMEAGGIIQTSEVAKMGIGFLDIADYTYISKFLSPQENQAVLNGLYTAFNAVLKRHGGYLNKIEGDSVMFHYGGPTDPRVPPGEDAAVRYIAKELFHTCVELQRVSERFNKADEGFFNMGESAENRRMLERAFDIISRLRSDQIVSDAFNALFQIRVRIGANIGDVTVGNFGPDGAKQWDIVGLPVIEAKRMESTALLWGACAYRGTSTRCSRTPASPMSTTCASAARRRRIPATTAPSRRARCSASPTFSFRTKIRPASTPTACRFRPGYRSPFSRRCSCCSRRARVEPTKSSTW